MPLKGRVSKVAAAIAETRTIAWGSKGMRTEAASAAGQQGAGGRPDKHGQRNIRAAEENL